MSDDAETLDHTRRPGGVREGGERNATVDSSLSSHADEDQADDEMDPRASEIELVSKYADLPDADLTAIMKITLKVYNDRVLVPARNTWRKDEGSRRELELEVERTALTDLTRDIKKAVDAKLGGCWHVVYGRDFGTYVSHQRHSFCYFQLDGANVVVWRHGM